MRLLVHMINVLYCVQLCCPLTTQRAASGNRATACSVALKQFVEAGAVLAQRTHFAHISGDARLCMYCWRNAVVRSAAAAAAAAAAASCSPRASHLLIMCYVVKCLHTLDVDDMRSVVFDDVAGCTFQLQSAAAMSSAQTAALADGTAFRFKASSDSDLRAWVATLDRWLDYWRAKAQKKPVR